MKKVLFFFIFLIIIFFYTSPEQTQTRTIINSLIQLPIDHEHVLAFLLFSLIGLYSFTKKSTVIILITLTSIALETLQIIIPNRSFHYSDILANILGIVLACLLHRVHQCFIRRGKTN